MGRTYTIRQLTKALGVTARTIRFYEEEAIVSPSRRGQTRLYSEEDWARLLVVLRGRRLGFSVDEMRQMLRNYDLKDSDARDHMLFAREKFCERLETLRQKAKDIEESIRQITGCIAEIDGALLEGKAKKPWHSFFADMAALREIRADPDGQGRAPDSLG